MDGSYTESNSASEEISDLTCVNSNTNSWLKTDVNPYKNTSLVPTLVSGPSQTNVFVYFGTQTGISSPNISISSEFLGRNWISNETLYKYFEILNRQLLCSADDLILNPIISHAVKNVTYFEHFLTILIFPGRKYWLFLSMMQLLSKH